MQRVGGPAGRDHLIGRQRQAAPLRPFLQGGLGGARRRLHLGDQRLPEPLDKGNSRVIAAVEIDRGDHRLANIGENGRVARRAGGRLGRRQPQMAVEPDLQRDPRQGVAAHQIAQAACQVAFRLVLEAVPQQIGDDEAEHPVAEKFEALVMVLSGRLAAPASLAARGATRAARRRGNARMGQRLGQQFGPRENMADQPREIVGDRIPGRRLSPQIHLGVIPFTFKRPQHGLQSITQRTRLLRG